MRNREPNEIYAFDDLVAPAPPLPGGVVVSPTFDQLIDHLTSDLVAHALNCVRQFGDFQAAFSGDEGLDPLFMRLMFDPDCRVLPWRRTHLWMVSERCSPRPGEDSLYRPIDESIVEHADIPAEQVHPLPAESRTADRDYERQLRESLSWREKGHDRLDYVLLLMGPDGGVAGLVPGCAALAEQDRLVRFSLADPVASPQVTMTLPLINAARFVAVLAVGPAVASTVRELCRGGEVEDLPARGIDPLNGELRWYLDADACQGAQAVK